VAVTGVFEFAFIIDPMTRSRGKDIADRQQLLGEQAWRRTNARERRPHARRACAVGIG
jgi:hypothetical protein